MIEKNPKDALAMISTLYNSLHDKHNAIRKRLDRGLTLAEKILFSHWEEGEAGLPVRGGRTEYFRPDRIAMQDATAQMALLQFISANKQQVAVPTTIHCDHLIQAREGVEVDLPNANTKNEEVYDFLASAGEKYGCGFWKPGSGIIHQVVLENYGFPGGMMIGTDSHTPNAGGIGMIAVGVGGADAVDVMVGMPWELLWPKLIGVKLTGKLSNWTSGKDVILKLLDILTVKGGTGKIVEYFGDGTSTLSCTAKATITNMGAELGATTSVFPYDENMDRYLRSTNRTELADLIIEHKDSLVADAEVLADPEKYYDEIIEIDLSTLEPHIVGPHTPDLAHPISRMKQDVLDNDWPMDVTACLIGSCTNSSYEDMGRAAHIARQAKALGLTAKVPFYVTPGSDRVYETIKRDGILADLEAIGAVVLTNACGPCIGQWERTDDRAGTVNSILTSYNRNFKKRNDSNADTCSFIASPEVVTAYALSGSFAENPLDAFTRDGHTVNLSAPSADDLPGAGFEEAAYGYIAPVDDGSGVTIKVADDSERLALIVPFTTVDKSEYKDFPVLLKAVGKCTTDHISPAGKWLRFRGHLDQISNNMFIGANNEFGSLPGTGLNVLTGETDINLSKIARDYKSKGQSWIAIGDENYGEGSSREHAAMCPRHLACLAVIAKSFARIHETNLKKQGILASTFVNPADYALIRKDDRLSFLELTGIKPGQNIKVVITHSDGSTDDFMVAHTFSEDQLEWFAAGSALNVIRAQ